MNRDTDIGEVDLAGAQILVVEDEPRNLDVLVEMLEPLGCNVRVAADGAEALEVVRVKTPDLILMDVFMPVMDGFETCRRLRGDPALRDISVLFLTARTDPEDVVAGFRAGGVDYIAKPFKGEELIARVQTHLRLRRALRELMEKNAALKAEIERREALGRERDQLAGRLSLLSEEEAARWGLTRFVGQSETLRKVLADIGRLQHAAKIPVLITGESGTGKELVARAIHYGSGRADSPFVAVNCSAIPGELADSLFFGHVKGAFTGADRDQLGYLALADGGTLFLDEIADMPLALQAKLLRVLEDGRVTPVGGAQERAVDLRVLSATNADLPDRVRSGRFREDLYYRLAGFPVHVPPLRERREDILLLSEHFLALFADEMGIRTPPISHQAHAWLMGYAFPGNVRELKHLMARALIQSGGAEIRPQHLQPEPAGSPQPSVPTISRDELPLNLRAAELAVIEKAVALADGNVTEAARLLGVHRMKIYRRLAKLE